MDVGSFFTRLVDPAARRPRNSASKGPISVESAEDFAQAWEDVRATLEEPDERQRLRGIGETVVPQTLDALVGALVKETTDHAAESEEVDRGPLMEYMLNHAVLATLVESSIGDTPFGVKACVIDFTSRLVRSIPDELLCRPSIIRPVCRLLRTSTLSSGEGTQTEVFDALRIDEPCASTSQVRLAREENRRALQAGVLDLWAQLWRRVERSPDLLSDVLPSSEQRKDTSGASVGLAGLAIGYLTRFIHDDAALGLTARTTLTSILAIIFRQSPTETMSAPRTSLARHLTGASAGFVNVLVAGLGAIYSVLPNKVRLDTAAELGARLAGGSGMSLGYAAGAGGTEGVNKEQQADLKCIFDTDVQAQINILLDLVAFVNDVLAATTYSGPVTELVQIAEQLRSGIEGTVRASLVGNVLYPALLESSAEDGSATAIAVYLTCLAEDDPAATSTVARIVFRELLGLTPASMSNDDLSYSLRDFLADSFAQGSRDSAVAASTLLSSLVKKYCSAFAGALIATPTDQPTRFDDDIQKVHVGHSGASMLSAPRFQPLDQAGAFQYMAAEILPVALSLTPTSSVYSAPTIKPYVALLRQLLPVDADHRADPIDRRMQDVYDSDAFARMSCHPCLVGQLNRLDRQHTKQQQHPSFRLDGAGPLLLSIQTRLRAFFTADPFANLEACKVVCDLSLCPMTSVKGWLSSRKQERRAHKVPDELDDPFLRREKEHIAIIDILRDLLKEADGFREVVPEFDQHLTERREGLTCHRNEIGKDAQTAPAGPESISLTPTKSRTPRMMSTLASYLTPRKQAETSKLAASAVDHMGTPTEVHYRQTTPVLLESPVQRAPLPESPYSLSKRRIRTIHRPLQSDTASTISSGSSVVPHTAVVNSNAKVTLSDVLDNMVVLEAFVREIVAVLVVRHSLSLDD
ncbi:hypothetical protein NliqN6_4715 [Naganishia liquefaciens]|uniref:Uncharacterized protein n=1 Tax=Naganishia liquefaciens TaxID=104408 RepID=A0A8H3YGH9_9TREE|nr:hypothetical protein NliqN6_4715 [Naganishia liquefaciens]